MANLQDHNYRTEPRLELEATILIETGVGPKHKPAVVILCNSLDLSAHGLQVVTDELFPPGSILRICIDMKNLEPIYLVAEVKWHRPDAESDAHRLGLLLFDSDETDIQNWESVVSEMLGNDS